MRAFSLSLIVGLIFLIVLPSSRQEVSSDPDPYYEANLFYAGGQYQKALQLYHQALQTNRVPPSLLPYLFFKIGYCYFKTGKFNEAVEAFQRKMFDLPEVEDYVQYFSLLSILQLGDTTFVLDQMKGLRHQYPESPLLPAMDSLMAELYLKIGLLDSARTYFEKMLNYDRFDTAILYFRLIQIAQLQKDEKTLKNYGYRFLRRFPFHHDSKIIYQYLINLYSNTEIPQGEFSDLFDFLLEREEFSAARKMLEERIQLFGLTEDLRWKQIKLLYEERKYWSALQACLEQRNLFQQARYRRNVDLTIARCYLRLGNVQKSIEKYEWFQRSYPYDRLSPEVLWKVAWLHENLKDLEGARQNYSLLVQTYPRSPFVDEARFRLGLVNYRLGKFTMAREYWYSLAGGYRGEDQSRLIYWAAKAFLKEKQVRQFFTLLNELAHEPFLSYYNLKAFLLTRDASGVHRQVDSLLWEMHHQEVSYLGRYLDRFSRVLLVQELLGNRFARDELNWVAKNLSVDEWEALFALAELHEKLGNYGQAFRLYRRIYNQHFSDKDWHSWLFLFKRLYPFYFNDAVTQYARKWQVNPAIIWALIKKESAFEPRITSYANAFGLMQIIPPTARDLTRRLELPLEDVQQLFEPEFNVNLGVFYLADLLKRYEGNLYYALAAYNAGPHRVARWRQIFATEDDDLFMENIEFQQTRDYVRRVMQYYWTYSLLLHPDKLPEEVMSFPSRISLENIEAVQKLN